MINDTRIVNKAANSEMVSVVLPGVSYYLKYGYAPARKLIDANAIVAMASDYNPGSCNISNIFFLMSIAALNAKMTMEEIISAFTINPAKALDVNKKCGSIEINERILRY